MRTPAGRKTLKNAGMADRHHHHPVEGTNPKFARPRNIRSTPSRASSTPARRCALTRLSTVCGTTVSAKMAGTVPRPNTTMVSAPIPALPATAARLAAAYTSAQGSHPCKDPNSNGATAGGACFKRIRPAMSQRPSPAPATTRAGSRSQPTIDSPNITAATPAKIATMPVTPKRVATACAICPKAPTMSPIRP